MKIKKLKKLKIAILWLGKEGKSSLSFLLGIWTKKIGVFDDREESMYDFSAFLVATQKSFDFEVEKENGYYKGKVKYLSGKKIIKIKFCFGNYTKEDLAWFESIIKAPWVSPYQEKFKDIQDKFTSQTQIFYNNYKGKVIGITGTKGKSTTSTLTYEALKKAKYKVKLVGNIWSPVLDEINVLAHKKYDFVVYEMSSYMLDHFKPKNYISVFNNIYTCHLDWHKDFDNYQKAKLNILAESKHRLVNSVFSHLAGKDKFHTFGATGDYSYHDHGFYIKDTKICDDADIQLKGEHNMHNITAVAGILHKILKKKKTVGKILKETLKSFKWLEHRMEKVGTFRGITFINDAIAVTPEATIAAIKTYSPDIETIFLWGKEAGYDFKELEKLILSEPIKNIILFPDAKIFQKESKGLKEEKFEAVDFWGKKINILKTRSMKNAVIFAYSHTSRWRVALLSCAAQSFSLWKNFEIKGAEFKKFVKELG